MSKDDKLPDGVYTGHSYWSYSMEVHIIKLVDDLGWEYDRMSSSGKETYDKLTKLLKED